MAARRLLVVCILVMTALAGCSSTEDGGESTTSSSSAAPAEDPCPQVSASSPAPMGWVEHGGAWGNVVAMEAEPLAVCGKATTALSHLVDHSASFDAVEAKVRFNMLDDPVGGGSGAGLVINWKDTDNYVIVRYSPREQGWHLFTMTDGERVKRDEASVAPPTTNPEYHQWVELTVRHEGGNVTAFDGTTKVIDYKLPDGSSLSGNIGYFLRDEGMAALFAGFHTTAL